jgi:hypothetical protein
MPRMQTAKDQGQYRVLTYRIYWTGHPIDFPKCDLALPACSQCLKTARVCEGYRTESDLLFRDHAKGASCETGGQRARVRSSAQSNLAISSVCKPSQKTNLLDKSHNSSARLYDILHRRS